MDASIKDQAATWVARRDAGLSSRERVEFESWLDADPRHRAAWEKSSKTWGALDRPHLAGNGDAFLDVLAERVQRKKRQRTKRVAAICSVAACLLVGGMYLRQPQATPSPLQESATALVLVPQVEILPDGSVVELKSGARIKVHYGAQRIVALEAGEAHFRVSKDPARPFIVKVDRVEVRAVGTQFSVDRGSTEVKVIVTEGRVALDKRDVAMAESPEAQSPAATTLAMLDAGDRTVLDFATPQTATVERVDAQLIEESLSWRAPRLEFTGTRLAEAVDLLNREAAKMPAHAKPVSRYVIADPAIADVRLSGLFRIDTSDAFVRLLDQGFGIDAQVQADGVIALSKRR